MSDIQKLLIESEMIQNPQTGYQEKLSGVPCDSKASPGRNDLTPNNIAKSRSLLVQLITCIDSLYKLSESRRTMSGISQLDKASKESLTKGHHPVSTSPSSSQRQGFRSLSEVAGDESQIEPFIRQDKLFINSSCITLALDSTSESEKPPPYEEVTPLENTRLPGMLDVTRLTAEQHSTFEFPGDRLKPVIVEYLPTMRQEDNALADQYCAALRYARQIFEHQASSDVCHAGSLRLLGYTIDISNARHGFVYEMPIKGEDYDMNDRPLILSNLRSVIPSKRDDTDQPSPNLDDRFRLAFNILLGLLQCSIRGLRHDNLDSTNIVLLLDQQVEMDSSGKYQLAQYDIRHPYLLHPPPLAETFRKGSSVAMYRHVNDPNVAGTGRSWAFDIYSFGLILLEIGLWTPVSRLRKAKYDRSTFTSRIKNIYVPKLASRCGTTYMKVVQSCINAPDLFEHDSPIAPLAAKEHFWSSYMIQIGRDLSRCCVIDVEGPPCEPDLAYFERWNDDKSSLLSPENPDQTASPVERDSRDSDHQAKTIETPPAEMAAEPQPAQRVQQTILKKWNNIDIPQECLDQWNIHLMPRISKLLQKALDSSRESCSASLMMVGKTPETAKTTICIQCQSVEKVRDCLKKNFKCKNGWALVVLRGNVRRSGNSRRKGKSHDSARSRLQPSQSEKCAYQQRPQFGASIGAYRDDEHLPPVSFGGAILVDGKPYGMTVHHMLDAPSDDEEEELEEECAEEVQRSVANDSHGWLSTQFAHPSGQEDLQERPDVLEISDDESERSTIRPDYIDLETGNGGFWFADDSYSTPDLEDDLGSDSDDEDSSDIDDDDEDDDRASVGDIVGIDPADEEEVYVTQPAIDDVEEDFFPCVEDRDEEHLASHSLGYVHASSGIRRVVTGSHKHEVDWALIKIRDERLAIGNTIQQQLNKSKRRRRAKGKPALASSSAEEPPAAQLTAVAPSSSLASLAVQCHGRTSGLQSGRISPALALVKLHGRTSFSSSWVVEGGGFGVPGDSGAWIYDPKAGRLCGHVLAWGRQSRTAYMAPMDLLFEDIRRRLGADTVELPGGEGLSNAASKQLKKSELDLLQDGIQKLSLPVSGKPMDGDVEMALDREVPKPDARPLELALGSLQISDTLSASRANTVAFGSKGKDLSNSLTCQVQERQQVLQKGLVERVLGSRVA
jgi:hypothetical protein